MEERPAQVVSVDREVSQVVFDASSESGHLISPVTRSLGAPIPWGLPSEDGVLGHA